MCSRYACQLSLEVNLAVKAVIGFHKLMNIDTSNNKISEKSEGCKNDSGKQSTETKRNVFFITISCTSLHNHACLHKYIAAVVYFCMQARFAATYVGMVMYDGWCTML